VTTKHGDAWRWVSATVIYAVHDRQLAEHGGAPGIRDQGVLEIALARPINVAEYGTPDVADLAAVYAYGLAKNHGFVDGNKRTAWIAARVFLAENGYQLSFDAFDAIRTMKGIASGSIQEAVLAGWFRERLTTRTT